MSQNKPKVPRPWDRTPWPERGDDNINDTYAGVGRALSQWERYEAGLALLFSAVVAGIKTTAAMRAYSAVRTFEARVEMLRAASAAYFAKSPDEAVQKIFVEVVRDAACFSPRRNDIAHGVVEIGGAHV